MLPEYREAALVEDQLGQNLALANKHALLGSVPFRPRSLFKRILYRVLQDLIAELNVFHCDVVRVLNKLARIFNGDGPAPAEIYDVE